MWMRMTLTRLKRTLTTLAALAILGGCANQPPASIPAFEAHDINVLVTGDAVMATTQVRTTTGPQQVDTVGLCAIDQYARTYEWPVHPVKLTPAWGIVASVRRFPAGSYTAHVCITANGKELPVTGAVKSFTVN